MHQTSVVLGEVLNLGVASFGLLDIYRQIMAMKSKHSDVYRDSWKPLLQSTKPQPAVEEKGETSMIY